MNVVVYYESKLAYYEKEIAYYEREKKDNLIMNENHFYYEKKIMLL